MKKLYLILFLLGLTLELKAQTAPSGFTSYGIRKWASGANPSADSLNANWTLIDSLLRITIKPMTTGTYDLGTYNLEYDSAFVQDLKVSGNSSFNSFIVTGTGAGTARTDAAIEIQHSTFPFLNFYHTGAASTSDEDAIAFYAKDASSNIRKLSSISSQWVNTSATVGYGNLRFNATYSGGNNDDVALKIYGNKGIRLFSNDASDGAGRHILRIDSGYVQAYSDGTNLSGNVYSSSTFRDAAGLKGVEFGYNSASQQGIILPVGASGSLAIWSHDGSSWAERYSITTTGNHLFTGDVDLTAQINKVNNIQTEGNFGVPTIVDTVTRTAQQGNITTTNFANSGVAGLYRVTYYLYTEVTDAPGGSLTATFGWNDGISAKTLTTSALATVGNNYVQGTVFLKLGSGNVTWATTYTLGSVDSYSFVFTVERIN